MSNYFINAPLIKNIHNNIEIEKEPKKKSKSQLKYIKASDIMTQAKPSYLNNFILPVNPHESSLTPSNHCNKLNPREEYLLPEKSKEFLNKKTLILDLDETLVHSSFTPFEKNDIILEVDFEGIMYNIYVKVRPYAQEFIQNVSKYYEIVIFTASISKYASPLLDILDKEKNIKYRLYRDHCTYINGIFIKNLKRLNRNLKDVIIVDNSPIAYAFDSENGLPIKTWYEDPYDKELQKIEPLIIFLSKTNDVRKYIDKFVDDNEILYKKAMSIIHNKENNENDDKDISDNEKDISNDDNDNNNNYINNLNIIDKFKLNDYKMNTLNLMKNKKFNLFSFNNIARINNNNTSNNLSSSKSEVKSDTEKNNIEDKENKNKNIENNKEGITSINNQVDAIKDTENNNNFKTNIINNNDKNNLKNKKPGIGILLRKESTKKKNIFRLSQKSDNNVLFNLKINKINNNFATNSFYNNNINNLMPLVLPFSNTAKNVLEPKKTFINNTNNKINIIPIQINNLTKNDSVENKLKIKYTNLLEKFEKNKILKNGENIKISSSIANNHQGLLPLNFNMNKKYELLQIPKSNSINDVLKFNRLGNKNYIGNKNNNKNLEVKTPNRHLLNIGRENHYNININFNQKLGKKNMLFNLIRGIGFSKTGRSKNTTHSANPSNPRNYSKSCKRQKKEVNN